jgi:rhodanese-related sulfurtransferase
LFIIRYSLFIIRYSIFIIRYSILLLVFASCRPTYDGLVAVQVPKDVWLARLHQVADEAQVIDVRFPAEYRRAHLEGAVNMSYIGRFARHARSLDPARPTFIYCHTAHRSPFATRRLKRLGFRQIIDLKGGYAGLQ